MNIIQSLLDKTYPAKTRQISPETFEKQHINKPIFEGPPAEAYDNMEGGRVVPPFDRTITRCGYCNRKLEWTSKLEGQEAPYNPNYPLYFGPKRTTWTYACPKYGMANNDYDGYDNRALALTLDKPWLSPKLSGGVWHYQWTYDPVWRMIRELNR